MKAHALIVISFAAVLIAQEPGSPRFDATLPRLLLSQVEAALSNGVPPAVLASNLNGLAETQTSSLLEACLAFDFSTNDIARTADAFELRVKAMQSLFGDRTCFVDRSLYRRYLDFCNQAYKLASQRDMSISEKWFQRHPLEPIPETLSNEERQEVMARNKVIYDAFEQYMLQWIEDHHVESSCWRIFKSYNSLIYSSLKLRDDGWENWKDRKSGWNGREN